MYISAHGIKIRIVGVDWLGDYIWPFYSPRFYRKLPMPLGCCCSSKTNRIVFLIKLNAVCCTKHSVVKGNLFIFSSKILKHGLHTNLKVRAKIIVLNYSGHVMWFWPVLGQHLWQLKRLAWKHKNVYPTWLLFIFEGVKII